MLFLSVLLNAIALGDASLIYPPQVTFQAKQPSPQALRGRFLHITDMHPDPHYVSHTSKRKFCHRGEKDVGSGYYGTPYSDCDSPLRLTNFTLDYLDSNWASEIDFVIWTGDNARHDSDESVPRTPTEIKDLNKAVAKKMREIFHERGIPVVPSIGNNDIWRKRISSYLSLTFVDPVDIWTPAHNVMTLGPNEITNAYSGIWKDFIPKQEQATFRRGAYFSTEVIPDKIAVLSLNTIYFYDSNDAAAGCPYDGPDDPGNLEFDWLEEKLASYRERGMQVWLTGHVPPSPGNYFSECYVRYVDLSLRFQDTILGHLYGHMNVDYFAFLETADLEIISEEASEARQDAFKHDDLYDALLEEFATLPESPEDIDLDDYAVINVSPSVVPHPYAPSFRIFSYNVTGDEGRKAGMLKQRNHRKHRGQYGDKETECGKEEWRRSWKCHLRGTWYSNPESPSRINQLWTPLGYAQYYVPHLEEADEEHEPEFELEYVTWGGKAGKTIYYGMSDLTVGSWVQLGQRLGQGEKQLRRVFKRHMYVGAGDRGRS